MLCGRMPGIVPRAAEHVAAFITFFPRRRKVAGLAGEESVAETTPSASTGEVLRQFEKLRAFPAGFYLPALMT